MSNRNHRFASLSGATKYRTLALAVAFLLGALLSGSAWAASGHGGSAVGVRHGAGFHGRHDHAGHRHGPRSHSHIGLYVGTPLAWGGYGRGWYDDPWGGPYARPLIMRPAPVIYVERGTQLPQWYYCAHPSGYYPYVKHCLAAWRIVPAEAPVQ